MALPDNPKFARYSHTHFLVRHVLFLAIAFVAAIIAFQVPLAPEVLDGIEAIHLRPARYYKHQQQQAAVTDLLYSLH